MGRKLERAKPSSTKGHDKFLMEKSANAVSVTYATARAAAIGNVLRRARAGELSENWREALEPPHIGAADTIYRRTKALAHQEVRYLPRADWEPYVASTWRQALDAWYLASWSNLDAGLDLRAQANAALRRTRLNTVTVMYREGRHSEIAALLDQQSLLDTASFLQIGIEIRDRDYLGALYRAGLAAGGESVDWVSWYRDCIGRWRDTRMATRALIDLEDPAYRARLEALPDYWCNHRSANRQ